MQHKYATHLLALLSSALPRSSYFSPMAKQLNDKDKKLLLDIKNEIQTYSLPSNGKSSGAERASALGYGAESAVPPVPPMNGVPAGAKGEVAGMLGAMQKQTQSIKRKPSPSNLGAAAGMGSDGLVAAVGFIFGVRREVWEGDLEDLRSAGSLEEVRQAVLSQLQNQKCGESTADSEDVRARSPAPDAPDQLAFPPDHISAPTGRVFARGTDQAPTSIPTNLDRRGSI